MKTVNDIYNAVVSEALVASRDEGFDREPTVANVVVTFDIKEGFYVWVFKDKDGIADAKLAIENYLERGRRHGWFGKSTFRATWGARSFAVDINNEFLETVHPFALTLKEFAEWLEREIASGQIKTIEASNVFKFQEREVHYYVDGKFFKTQDDLQKYLSVMKLQDLIESNGAVDVSDATKLVMSLVKHKEVVIELLKGL
jgi:hypothetical protein